MTGPNQAALPRYSLLANELSIGADWPEERPVAVPLALLRHMLRLILEAHPFDTERYERANPDVAASVRRGEFPDARRHWIEQGYFEGRAGVEPDVAQSWYLRVNPDVARAVEAAEWHSAAHHFDGQGAHEWRSPNEASQAPLEAWRHALRAARPALMDAAE